eukprot:scaffold16963_cov131-Isochrysis_galbana.AAC.5
MHGCGGWLGLVLYIGPGWGYGGQIRTKDHIPHTTPVWTNCQERSFVFGFFFCSVGFARHADRSSRHQAHVLAAAALGSAAALHAAGAVRARTHDQPLRLARCAAAPSGARAWHPRR